MSKPGSLPWKQDAIGVLAVALCVRLAVVGWAANRFGPVADAVYYNQIAERIAAGLGYTWAWPDGVVTYAAHYPVGYAGLVGGMYALFGAHLAVAMILNAVIGALAAPAVHRLVTRAACETDDSVHFTRRSIRWVPLLGGCLVALHPGLVSYTPALMTEGVISSLVACCVWVAAWADDQQQVRRRYALLGVVGLLVGISTLIRPQVIVLGPALGLMVALRTNADCERLEGNLMPKVTRSLVYIAVTTLTAILVCLPWTVRNCIRMNQCALVSMNDGWNLLIGANAASTGGWTPLEVPEACREVFDEAAKNGCFRGEGLKAIVAQPLHWVALVPRKLAMTFNGSGAGAYYLNASNKVAFGDAARSTLTAIETVYQRGSLLLALVYMMRLLLRKSSGGPRDRARGMLRIAAFVLFLVGAFFAAQTHGWVGYMALLGLAMLHGHGLVSVPFLASSTFIVLAATALTHAVFFGASRYALVVLPLLCGLCALGAASIALVGQRVFKGDAEANHKNETNERL